MPPDDILALREELKKTTVAYAGIKEDPAIQGYAIYAPLFNLWSQGDSVDSALTHLKKDIKEKIRIWEFAKNEGEGSRVFSEEKNCQKNGLSIRTYESYDTASKCQCFGNVVTRSCTKPGMCKKWPKFKWPELLA